MKDEQSEAPRLNRVVQGGRPAERLAESVIEVDLDEVLERLRASDSYGSADHSARVLVKRDGLRVVLIALHPAGRMHEHHAGAPISVHCLGGRIQFTVEGRTHELTAGALLSVEAGLTHSAAASEESAFLLTLGGLSG